MPLSYKLNDNLAKGFARKRMESAEAPPLSRLTTVPIRLKRWPEKNKGFFKCILASALKEVLPPHPTAR